MKNDFAFVERNSVGAFEVIMVEDGKRFDTPCVIYCNKTDANEYVKIINKKIEMTERLKRIKKEKEEIANLPNMLNLFRNRLEQDKFMNSL